MPLFRQPPAGEFGSRPLFIVARKNVERFLRYRSETFSRGKAMLKLAPLSFPSLSAHILPP